MEWEHNQQQEQKQKNVEDEGVNGLKLLVNALDG